MMVLIDGKKVSAEIRGRLEKETAELKTTTGRAPGLATVLVGEDPASAVYVRNKNKICHEVGFQSFGQNLPAETTEEELLDIIKKLNSNDEVNGILVQLPLPDHIDSEKILLSIDPEKDVDGFHPINVGKLAIGNALLTPCTPTGIIALLDYYKIEISGKHAVVLGRSNIVGKPVAHLLLQRHATVTICHSKTKNMQQVTRHADILIAAVGRPHFVNSDMVKEDVVVIDVGINRVDGKLTGDVEFDTVAEKAGFITPVPGGVGPMTIALLMENTLKAFKATQ
ncbi:MAG: bifunctional methylenetetrahydrofolate dehydrogenase/methenyltetrahydrofolate cyclohydrolase FolD [Nitrospina sp.]|nr:bifunctional methylenetetrahydrofolate dehydrogenase/methenyltetrahydrofolate cyclohydrolase FolD [Nitrospina sp.]